VNRVVSLDVFRGLTVAFMILVNNPGSGQYVYPPLRHADWHGWTPTDLVFPFFLWIVGVSMTISFARRIEQGHSRASLWGHAIRRGALIFLIGLVLNLIPRFDFETVRVMGVLQRIGLCYILGASIYLATGIRGQIAAVVILLVGYWAVMTQYPVPGYGPGVLEKEGNFAQWVDLKLLAGHMWAQSKTWDPEGIVSTFPAVGNVLLGALAGHLLRARRTAVIPLLGAILTVGGFVWNIWFPINKPIWTSSYVLLTCGLASIAFFAVWWIIDEQGWRAWAKPFEWLGTNALVAFVGSGLLARILSLSGAHRWLWENVYSAVASPVNASLLFALSEVLVFVLMTWWMWKRRIFVRL
jgi:predicted acyltransferase